jgi:hypothetical protein
MVNDVTVKMGEGNSPETSVKICQGYEVNDIIIQYIKYLMYILYIGNWILVSLSKEMCDKERKRRENDRKKADIKKQGK